MIQAQVILCRIAQIVRRILAIIILIDCCAYHFQTRKPHFQTFKLPLVINAPCRIIYIMYTKVSKRARKRRFCPYFPHL